MQRCILHISWLDIKWQWNGPTFPLTHVNIRMKNERNEKTEDSRKYDNLLLFHFHLFIFHWDAVCVLCWGFFFLPYFSHAFDSRNMMWEDFNKHSSLQFLFNQMNEDKRWNEKRIWKKTNMQTRKKKRNKKKKEKSMKKKEGKMFFLFRCKMQNDFSFLFIS